MNDFDETLPGPWEWDLKRLAASMVVAARDRGFDRHQGRHAAKAACASYRTHMAEYATMRAIDVYYSRVDVSEITAYVDKRARPYVEQTVKAAAHHDTVHELPKLTAVVDGERRIVDIPPTIYPPRVVATRTSRRRSSRSTGSRSRRIGASSSTGTPSRTSR